MAHAANPDPVDQLARRRAAMAHTFALAFLAVQASAVTHRQGTDRFDIGFALWSALLLIILLFGGGWLSGPKIRSALNDESTIAHRRSAMACGFLVMLLSAFIIYAVSFYHAMAASDSLRLLITFSVCAALFRFAALERKALQS